jgi:hypothetical protein
VKNGINGFCVESENEFIQKTYEVLMDSSLEKKLSKQAFDTSKNFTRETFKKQLENIFVFN